MNNAKSAVFEYHRAKHGHLDRLGDGEGQGLGGHQHQVHEGDVLQQWQANIVILLLYGAASKLLCLTQVLKVPSLYNFIFILFYKTSVYTMSESH